MSERKSILLRMDPAVHDALARWANDDLRSTNAQIEFLLRRVLSEAGRLPKNAGSIRRRGRPRKRAADADDTEDTVDAADSADTVDGGTVDGDTVDTAGDDETSDTDDGN